MDKNGGSGFFAVDRTFMEKALDLGLNPAVAFLVLARGTGPDNCGTSWSVNAVENYTGIGRARIIEAINKLKSAGCVENTKAGTRPRYALGMAENPTLIWLPNTLVTGAANETPPLELIRQTQNVDALRLFMRCYAASNMPDDGGLPRNVIHGTHEVKTVREVGQYRIICYSYQMSSTVYPDAPLCEGFFNGGRTPDAAKREKDRFWSAWRAIEDTGLLQAVPFVVDALSKEGGEPIHPLGFGGRDSERYEDRLAIAAHDAGVSLLGGRYAANEGRLIPVPRHMAKATIETVYRPLYRPHTRQISKWFAAETPMVEEHLKAYAAISTKSEARASRMQHQI